MKLLKRLFLCMLCLSMFVAGCSTSTTKIDDLQGIQLEGEQTLTAAFTNPLLQDMKGIAENSYLQLYINDQTAEIAVLDKRSGQIWRSNPTDRDGDPIASGEKKDLLSAQVTLEFCNEFGQYNYANSYTDSIAYKQVAYKLIPDGVRVTYKFGKIEKTIEDLPKMISKQRFEEKILSKIEDNTLLRTLKIAYREDKEKGVYVRNDGLSGIQLKRTLQAFEIAGYTEEDLAYDLAEHNLTQTKPVPRLFYVILEYKLEGDSLVVRVPVDGIRYLKEYPVHEISILNFFGAGGPSEEGALFVPDGSGALIYFNNGKSKYTPYRQEIYGTDLTVDNTEFLIRAEKARMPVFGVIKKNSALLGIIEEGAAVAIVNADVSGRENSYNYVYPSFYVINKDDVTLQGEGQKRSFPRYQEEPMKTDFVVRYVFLNGKEACYEGMAKYYQQYLIKNNMLRENKDRETSNSDIPFYLQLIGSIPTRKHFVGVPYRALEPLTTFEQAKIILSELEQLGVSNIKLKYSGWFNEGEYHKVPKSISVDGVIGGRKGLNDFLEYIKEKNVSFYPDVALLRVYNTSGFNETREAARRLTALPAAVYPIDLASNRRDRDRYPSYVLSPRYVKEYVEKMLSGIVRLNFNAISLRDLADELNSDYRKNNQIDRTESEKISIQALDKIYQSGLNIMVKGGNAYAWPYVTDITDVSLGNSKYKIEDEAIPFYQMVIRGFIEYTGTPYNLSTYTNHRQYVLKCLEYGSNVYFVWSYEPSHKVKDTDFDYLYSIYYREWIGLATQVYRQVNEVLKRVNNQEIISHQKIKDGVFKTVYENGVYVIVNYNRAPVFVEGVRIEAEDFYVGGDSK
ncbi:hypothetical protein JOD02_000965 [Caldicoprobacter guelmensis]|uniref:DUF5696 domain-containing protein n=1 Tax=Caldicoprobacter guelmensis TaxID=1170224 RepID=UPI001955FD6C|nr:DUF5696 domain-containing protein [Caldicoprobacter guelmensis]MBM7582108.1 hypothetical protein [Caldicoprobacter guelmensis]